MIILIIIIRDLISEWSPYPKHVQKASFQNVPFCTFSSLDFFRKSDSQLSLLSMVTWIPTATIALFFF